MKNQLLRCVVESLAQKQQKISVLCRVKEKQQVRSAFQRNVEKEAALQSFALVCSLSVCLTRAEWVQVWRRLRQ